MTEQSCDLIGMCKFLSAGPRILPKFIRPFSSLEVGSGDKTMKNGRFYGIYMALYIVVCLNCTIYADCYVHLRYTSLDWIDLDF